ncbi:hypothetical protein CLI64_02455 [Nostoc sp. CENA543]|uniref:hypothetical protein n=1 Tax=Nostoc sp. CENA543 TaxID=1869241 RepID=UPI000CA34368|nr:hypothetical protein [Nostoc sp. CENA543]AUS99344.1 hypothetical protein CLI64_02455 [Nostoc sp. CENA543]
MTDEVKPNPSEATTHDAQLLAESIDSGEAKAPQVDFDADYAAAQQLSAGVDVEAVNTPEDKTPQPEATKTEAPPTGNPEDYLELAKEVGASKNEAVTQVSDDLVQKAIDMGQAKK